MIKEVIFFCYGDSAKPETWSNLPFLFTRKLEKKNILVHRVDINPERFFNSLYNRLVYPILKSIYPGMVYTFDRTRLCALLTQQRISKAVKKYKTSDLCIFDCFDYYNKYSDIPSLLFSDWTMEILLSDRFQRVPYPMEKRFIQQQAKAIMHADYVVSLFPICADWMKRKYPQANIHYLGGNVINSFYEEELDSSAVVRAKYTSNSILFIGGKNYIDSALMTIEAKKLIQNRALHMIGLTEDMVKLSLPNVCYHGYLRKDNKRECQMYYKLVFQAKVFVNANPRWGGYSSSIEAMYYHTPIVISPYQDFVQAFVSLIDFGIYNEMFTSEEIASNIKKVCNMNEGEYKSFCFHAHERVEDYTWKRY